MKIKELREMHEQELERLLTDSVEELHNLRFQQASDQIENPGRIRRVRRSIARIRTIMRERRNS